VVRAAKVAQCASHIVVATTNEPEDQAIVDLAIAEKVEYVRGSTTDVLERFITAKREYAGDVVIRLTGDTPLVDPALIRALVSAFQASDLDYIASDLTPSIPRGTDVEVIGAPALERAAIKARDEDRAHVTSYIYRNPELFRIAGMHWLPRSDDLRYCLDTPEDAELLSAIVRELGDRPPPWQEVVTLLRRRPDLTAINAMVKQKPIDAG